MSKMDLTHIEVDRCTENDGSWIAQMVAPKNQRRAAFIETHKAKLRSGTIQDSSKFVIQSLDANNYAEDVLKFSEKSISGCWFCRNQTIEHWLIANSVPFA